MASLSTTDAKEMILREDVKKMENLAFAIEKAPMPAGIRIYQAEMLVARAQEAFNAYVQKATALINDASSYPIRSEMRYSLNNVRDSHSRKVGRVRAAISQAKAQGQSEIPGQYVAANIGLFLHDIAGGYLYLAETESYKPFLVKLAPEFMLRFFVKVAEVVETIQKYAGIIWKALTDSIDAAGKGLGALFEALKWGTIAGGLYLLYRALEPKKKPKALPK